VHPVSHENLGVTIAYILPGFLALWGLGCLSPTIDSWLNSSSGAAPSVGGFLYVALASLALGIFANILRRLLIDPIHHRTGIAKKQWKYILLQDRIDAIQFIVLHQFRYYQFAGNSILALAFTATVFELCLPNWTWQHNAACGVVEVALYFGSRDNLRLYYRRLEEVLAPLSASDGS
jgi:hypothetical protein